MPEIKPLPKDSAFLLKDLVAGDEAVSSRPEFLGMTGDELQRTMNLIVHNPKLSEQEKKYLMMNSWRIHYRSHPPEMSSTGPYGFLTEAWIGPTAQSVYPEVQRILTEYWSPTSEKRNLLLASAIGTGKSFASTLSELYLTAHLWSMRDPKKFFGLSQATSIVNALISFTMEKAEQLLLQPFYQILLSSPKFRRVKMEEYLEKKQRENPDQICWTSAGKVGVLQFSNDIHFMIASSPAKLLGLNMISAVLSEISFFIDQGFSAEYIWRIFNDSKTRIQSRFGHKYFATCILDSSPNDIEASPIDKYIFSGEAAKDPENYIVTGSQWAFCPWKYPEWQKTGKTFPVFRGSAGNPSKVLEEEKELTEYAGDEIYQVPIDLKQAFVDNTVKAVKDFCGWPAGTLDRLLRDYELLEKMFDPQLRNIYTHIHVPESAPAEGTLWNLVVNKFFINHGSFYEFYRAPRAPRFIHNDLAESRDNAALSMVHPEMTSTGVVWVTDFTIVIQPGKERINLNAIMYFIYDLVAKGHLNLQLVTFDQYQSSSSLLWLKERGISCERLSVDSDPNIYLAYVSFLTGGRLKAGRNIYLKNNIKSLQEVRTEGGHKKIDHFKGKLVLDDGGKWETSLMGTNAKDCSDANCGAFWNGLQNFRGAPQYWYTELGTGAAESDSHKKDAYIQKIRERAVADLSSKFGLREGA